MEFPKLAGFECGSENLGSIEKLFLKILQTENIAVLIELLIIGVLFLYVWQIRKDKLELDKQQAAADSINAKANIKLAQAIAELKIAVQTLISVR